MWCGIECGGCGFDGIGFDGSGKKVRCLLLKIIYCIFVVVGMNILWWLLLKFFVGILFFVFLWI